MKIRNGFVSNSSTSSFCIFGIFLSDRNMDEDLEKKVEDAGLEFLYGPSYPDSVYIGRSFSSIKDDETGGQFKDDVREKLKALGIPGTAQLCEEAWYDG